MPVTACVLEVLRLLINCPLPALDKLVSTEKYLPSFVERLITDISFVPDLRSDGSADGMRFDTTQDYR